MGDGGAIDLGGVTLGYDNDGKNETLVVYTAHPGYQRQVAEILGGDAGAVWRAVTSLRTQLAEARAELKQCKAAHFEASDQLTEAWNEIGDLKAELERVRGEHSSIVGVAMDLVRVTCTSVGACQYCDCPAGCRNVDCRYCRAVSQVFAAARRENALTGEEKP